MRSASINSTFLLGLRDGLPFWFVAGPFGFLFGIVATEAGLNVFETLMFTVVVVAGASQFTVLQMLSENAGMLVSIFAALAVNLRMAMYSAALTPWLGRAPLWQRGFMAFLLVDQCYACSIGRYEEFPDWSISQRVRYFFGSATALVPFWAAVTLLGAVVGQALPSWLQLDFAMPICFLALVAPMLRSAAHISAAAVSIILSLLFAGLPSGVGLMAAAMLAMMTGAAVEQWMTKRAAESEANHA